MPINTHVYTKHGHHPELEFMQQRSSHTAKTLRNLKEFYAKSAHSNIWFVNISFIPRIKMLKALYLAIDRLSF